MKFKVVGCLLLLLMYGQVIAQNDAKCPFEYKLSLRKFNREAKTLTVNLSLKNISDKSVVIDKNSLSYKLMFQKIGTELDEGGISSGEVLTTTGHHGNEYEGNYLILSPGRSYSSTRIFNLNEKFFDEKRTFILSIVYGQFLGVQFENLNVWEGTIKSNELSFVL
jgi:hypothetical protein